MRPAAAPDDAADSIEGLPRAAFLAYVRRVLEALSSLVQLRDEGALEIDGFRLRCKYSEQSPKVPIGQAAAINDYPAMVRAHVEALAEIAPPEVMPGASASASWTAQVEGETLTGVFPVLAPDEDFVFSYALAGERGSKPSRGPVGIRRRVEAPAVGSKPASPAEYVAGLVGTLLDTVELLVGDRPVVPRTAVVNGLSVHLPVPELTDWTDLGSRSEKRRSPRQPLHGVAATEPAIVTLARHWALLAPYLSVDSEAGDGQGRIDGFHLRRARDWVVPSSGHPAEMYEYLARVCNVSCEFCYLYGNPSAMAIARGLKVISEQELATRLRYFDPERKQSLFHAQWEINEFLIDPKTARLLPELRARSSEPFLFITNGSPLTEQVCDLLAATMPVHVIVSVNTIDAEVRASVMRERKVQTDTALSSLARLSERRIPFAISLAAFPDFSVNALERTVEAIRPLDPTMVRVNLPGFTRELPYRRSFDTEEQWITVLEWLRSYRTHCDVPLISIPSAFEADRLQVDPNAPYVVGAVKHSPAAAAGIRPGDLIRRVGFCEVETRAQLSAVLMLMRGRTKLLIERDGNEIEVWLETEGESGYPYTGHHFGKYQTPCGFVIAPSLGWDELRQVREFITTSEARRTWIVTSQLMRRAADLAIKRELGELAAQIDFVIADNDFLGGNIRILDMATIGDIGAAVQAKLAHQTPPDLLLVPGSGFNAQGRDITGRHWGDLERGLGITTRLIDVAQFRY